MGQSLRSHEESVTFSNKSRTAVRKRGTPQCQPAGTAKDLVTKYRIIKYFYSTGTESYMAAVAADVEENRTWIENCK